jgi:adenosylcobinamide amidohydrolase
MTSHFKHPHTQINQQGRFFCVELLKPHRVLSTSQINGGIHSEMRFLINHQSCEGSCHDRLHDIIVESGAQVYHNSICNQAKTDPKTSVIMGTAANMQYTGYKSICNQGMTVTALATAGVEGNAARAGDSAAWVESASGWQQAEKIPGTINIIVLIDHPLNDAALSRAISTLTEAKTTVLLELGVSSKYSAQAATGTGTDQFIIAAALDERPPKTWSGHHCRLGELIALCVRESLFEALHWQNGLNSSSSRNLLYALKRYGLNEEGLKASLASHSGETPELLLKNFMALIHDPAVSACAWALVALKEKADCGVLPPALVSELLVNQCALLSCTLGHAPDLYNTIRKELLSKVDSDFKELLTLALIKGYSLKWSAQS